ncbi:DSBA oxidoreductase [Parvibaculum lavamentivorans DS-1]|uniref:2-hydroxychromene-2-carboxylate isomerase n=1 Tax=Parvibaculum lavamentivorans (strain DS-1 / DSM 13023 / NCIMB 13966) TaxID=402881 RepID=A7HTQ9_PARL1|nr:DsbA family protein [Parvibaculum lavamentivorans]ABS63292.1 DSBA oxidoreductase [Parvibaculum lavamentivorans DS-1]
MTLEYDLFWSFRSPYSYLVTPRLLAFEREYDVKCNVRPVYPIAVRIDGFFKQVNPMWPPYLLKDTMRVAEMEGLPYAWPSPDPVRMDMKSGEVPKEQPYIHRLTRAGVAAAETGQGLAFLKEISSVIFGGVKNWHEGDHLKEAAARAGLDMDALDRIVEEKADSLEAVIAANEAAQKAAGHWGVPLMVFEGEPFFGQDRLSHLKWRMEQKGLKRR